MIKRIVQRVGTLVLAGTLLITSISGVSSSAAKKKEVDLNGKYHASLGIQTATEIWMRHMAYYDSKNNPTYGTDKADKFISDTGEDHEGTFTDVEIAGNGTYTVKVEGADFQNEQVISQLHLATDIPVNDSIKFTDVKAIIDDEEVLSFEEGWLENEEPYLSGGMVVVLLNHWRDELIGIVKDMGRSEDASNGYTLLKGTGQESVSIQFTVSGFAYDNPDAVAETPEPTEAPKATDAAAKSTASDAKDSGLPTGAVAGIVVAVVAVIAIIVGIVVSRRKKS